jgi:predicted nucleotidyltransferase
MEFTEKKRKINTENNYHLEHLKLSREFAKRLLQEMGELVRSIVIFGSTAKSEETKDSDIDILVVLNNVSVFVTPELRNAYQIIVNKITSDLAEDKFHILTMNLSDLWDYSRTGDPTFINILRTGFPLFDRDLIEPMQYLLEIGKIRPTFESITKYSARSRTLLDDSKKHITEAILDLYYSVVDAVHAYLMSVKEQPPSPKEMPKLLKKHLPKQTKIHTLIEELYHVEKSIEHKKVKTFTGKDFDKYYSSAQQVVQTLHKEIEKELKQKDLFEL